MVARQAPLSMELSRQEPWSGLPFPPPGNLPGPGIEPRSPALQSSPTLQADSLSSEPPGKPQEYWSGLLFPSLEDLPTQGLNPDLLCCRQILQCLSHKGNPGGMATRYNQIPYSLGGRPTHWRITVSPRVSHRNESSEHHIRPRSPVAQH